jgi:CRISPR/Cas system-associated exonuclease Cas4 (RecB family)
MTSRSRTFIYEIPSIYENIDEKIESLKQIDCRYHIIGFDKDTDGKYTLIKGFLLFNNAKTIQPVIKITKINSIKYAEEDSYSIHKQLSEMQTFWETGSLPKQSHPRKRHEEKQLDSASKEIYNYLMKQNQQIFEKFFEDKQNLQDDKKQLQEELFKIKEENARLKERESLVPFLQNSLLIPQSINQTNTNSHNITNKNKTFNINMFLNEQCKDAITLSEFIQKIQIENEDLFYAKDHGYVDAMVRLLINSLKQYTITERPLHCTDIKRETMHIKNENGWVKEKGSESEDMTNAIKSLSNKKMKKVANYIQNEGKAEYATRKGEENIELLTKVSSGAANPEKTFKKIVKGIVETVKLEE